jgi:uncharacterized protein YkwD
MSRGGIVIAVAVVLAAVAAGMPTAAGASGGSSRDLVVQLDRIADLPALEARLLAEINDLRQEQGLAPLRSSAGLAAAAHEQSTSMAERGFFGHESPGGSPFWKRVESKYAKLTDDGSWQVGENLVWGSPRLSAGQALDVWLNSPPHRKNLLTRTWREIGISAVHASAAPGVYAGQDVTILTVDFGVRH